MNYWFILLSLFSWLSIGLQKECAIYGLNPTKKIAENKRLRHSQTMILRSELFKHIETNNLLEVIHLLALKGVDPNKRLPGNSTPLVIAIRKSKEDMVAILLMYNAHPDIYCWHSKTQPLLKAVELNNLPIVKKLIEHKVDLERVDNELNTALTYACTLLSDQQNTCNIIWHLIHVGANIHHRNAHQNTALSLVCTKNYHLTDYLLESKAIVNTWDRLGRTPLCKVVLQMSETQSSFEIEKLTQVAVLLLKYGADPDICSKKGYSPRSIAKDALITHLRFPPKKDQI